MHSVRHALWAIAPALLLGCGADPPYQTTDDVAGKSNAISLPNAAATPKASALDSSRLPGSLDVPTSTATTTPVIIDPRLLLVNDVPGSVRDSVFAMQAQLSRGGGLSKDPLAAMPDLRNPAGGVGNPEFEGELSRGTALLTQKKFDEALACFQNAKRLEPYDYRGFLAAAVCQAQRGQPSAALAEIGIAIERAPKEESLYLQRGHIHAALGRESDAIADFSRYLTAHPEAADALIARGIAALRSRQPKTTIADAEALRKLQPKLPDALLLRALGNFGMFNVRLGENQREQAVEYYNRARRDFDESVALGLHPTIAASWRKTFYPE